MNLSFDNLPQNIKVQVDYYNKKEKDEFEANYPNSEDIEKLAGSKVEIPTVEFLVYWLFNRKIVGKNGWSNRDELSKKTHKSLSELEDWIEYKNNTLYSPDGEDLRKHQIEDLGVAVGLSIANKLHDMSFCDWDKIPETTKLKTLDFTTCMGSDGKSHIEVENKGSFSKNIQKKTSSVSNHKSDIKDKKTAQKAEDRKNKSKTKAVRYGTITVISDDPKSTLQCWLVDPEPNRYNVSPEAAQILNRLTFYAHWISLITPRSIFSVALQNRLKALSNYPYPKFLSNIPLVNSVGASISKDRTEGRDLFQSLSVSRSHTADNTILGDVILLDDGSILFIGLHESVIRACASQNFHRLVRIKPSTKSSEKRVRIVLRKQSKVREALKDFKRDDYEKGPYVRMEASVMIAQSNSGFAFGFIDPKNIR
ncbi:hypothetical protein SAMN02745181_1261 [Rubritalea squalenifaciens DSM 18772]|uniref:Uncharacterized protein n=1 Tax=Rubritalea squalenifaciens DSM 18772 TaxID=1123071 RepID=A0A1M6GT86_9BACT|nr:hypothetical protein [Rubritalea squalenifaciens]SHJ13185.1 hypothetical protein SAMN02745181_1261 [Rubritalea squalenifaciens DSM 18772]